VTSLILDRSNYHWNCG